MRIIRAGLGQPVDGDGVVVVIDVLRAFTTAAYAFAAGASAIFPVASAEDGMRLRRRYPEAITIGAMGGGLPIPGFDLGNSPSQLDGLDLRGRELIHYTAAGVRGLVQQRRASALFAASFVCARATASAIRRLQPATVTLIATGDWIDRDGDEDHACADYLQALLRGEPDQPDPTPFVERVRTSDFGRRFNDPGHPAHPAADLGCAAIADRFDFALEVTRADDLLIMTKAMP